MSDIPGTTTDPVRKAMEIPGIGPCVFTDTAGFDDDAAGLGEKRTGLTLKALEKTDIALMIFSDCGPVEKEWYRGLVGKGVPTVPVISKADLEPSATGSAAGLEASVTALCGESPVRVSSLTGEGIDGIFRALLRRLPEDFGHRDITGDLVKKGDAVLLVMPQDIQAPKGRLILPQVQTIRELLDKGCTVVGCTAAGLADSLAAMSSPPALVITDSSVFAEVHGLQRTPPVVFERLALPGEDGYAQVGHGRCGVVLGGVDVARGPAHLCAQGAERLDEHGGLDGHVQGAGDACAFEGLPSGVLLLEGHEAGHLVFGQFDFFMAEVGESEVGYLVGEG